MKAREHMSGGETAGVEGERAEGQVFRPGRRRKMTRGPRDERRDVSGSRKVRTSAGGSVSRRISVRAPERGEDINSVRRKERENRCYDIKKTEDREHGSK